MFSEYIGNWLKYMYIGKDRIGNIGAPKHMGARVSEIVELLVGGTAALLETCLVRASMFKISELPPQIENTC